MVWIQQWFYCDWFFFCRFHLIFIVMIQFPFFRDLTIIIIENIFYRCPLYNDLFAVVTVLCVVMKKQQRQWPNTNVYGNKGIYIDFLGRAHCHWTEGTGSKKESHTGLEIYLEQRQYLLGGRTGKWLISIYPLHITNHSLYLG